MRNRLLRGLVPALALAALPAISSAGVFIGVSVNIAPPPLPVYVQPPCPEPGYIWTPGYWAWDDGAYYWVPGTWVLPPEVGLLWTPGYWGWYGGAYRWHVGYWGPHVGFYGGVHYGFGYDGEGFAGGYWRGGQFFYNRAVWHVGPRFVTNVYYHPVVYHTTYQHVSFNGGPGGVPMRPTRAQMVAEHEHHFSVTQVQQRQQRMAFSDRALRADYNHGRPPIAATERPTVFHGNGAFAARAAGGPVHFAPAHNAAPMRSDRPTWATGQSHAARPMERNASMHAERNFDRPQQRFERAPQQRPDARQQHNFQGGNFRPMERPQARPQPQYHQQPQFHGQPQFRQQPQSHEQPQLRQQPQFRQQPQMRQQPQFHQQFRPQARGPESRPEPRPQQRGGERHPPENRGHR